MTTLSELCDEYEAYCKANGLPYTSADELLCHDSITPEQRVWLNDFIQRWQAGEDAEHAHWHHAKAARPAESSP